MLLNKQAEDCIDDGRGGLCTEDAHGQQREKECGNIKQERCQAKGKGFNNGIVFIPVEQFITSGAQRSMVFSCSRAAKQQIAAGARRYGCIEGGLSGFVHVGYEVLQ